jgi:hypothetical protein
MYKIRCDKTHYTKHCTKSRGGPSFLCKKFSYAYKIAFKARFVLRRGPLVLNIYVFLVRSVGVRVMSSGSHQYNNHYTQPVVHILYKTVTQNYRFGRPKLTFRYTKHCLTYIAYNTLYKTHITPRTQLRIMLRLVD